MFERRFNYRKDTKKINVSSYRKETRRETTVFLPSDKVRGHWFGKNGLKLGKSFCKPIEEKLRVGAVSREAALLFMDPRTEAQPDLTRSSFKIHKLQMQENQWEPGFHITSPLNQKAEINVQLNLIFCLYIYLAKIFVDPINKIQ